MNDIDIGVALRALRTSRHLSQAQLAKLAGTDWNERLIARMENGSRPLRYTDAVALARALGVPVSAFAGDTSRDDLLAQLSSENRILRTRLEDVRKALQ